MAAKPSLKNTKIVDKQTAAESVFQVQADEPSTHQPPELQASQGTHTEYLCLEILEIFKKYAIS